MSPTAEPIHDTTATCQDAGTLMATFGITQEPGPYVYGGHRYDKLTDAVHYAQRHFHAVRHIRCSTDHLRPRLASRRAGSYVLAGIA